MKKCPQCTRVYDDESLNFCLHDGTVLIKFEKNVTDENIPRQTEQQTEIIPPEKISEVSGTESRTAAATDENLKERETVVRDSAANTKRPKSESSPGVSPVFAYLTVGLLAILVLIAGIALVVWINSNTAQNSNANVEISKTLTNENDSDTADNKNVEPNLKPTETTTPVLKPTPKPTEKAPKEKVSPEPEKTPKPTETPAPADGRYFVILGSFPQSQAARARQRLLAARSKGLNARIINTSNFPGLRSGLIAVVMGPYSKSEAQNALRKARSVSGDAYIKAGTK